MVQRAKKHLIALTGLEVSLLVLKCPLLSMANDPLVLPVLDLFSTGSTTLRSFA